MDRRFVFGAALAAAAAFGMSAAYAANPSGSYQKTCSNISVSGTTLSASCKTFNQQNMQTSLPYYASCVGDIGNINGVLACAGPNGSYALTCTGATVTGTTLKATCKKKDQTPVPASLANFQGFQGDISNCDGKLQNGAC
jgi:hypothetical protein